MLFANLSVKRLIIHEVFRRRDDKQLIPPQYGGHLIQLAPDAVSAFSDRVIAALGSQSKCMEMAITNAGPGSCFQLVEAVLNVPVEKFVDGSRAFADKLAQVQTSRNVPGGIVVVFDGEIGYPPVPFVGIIKAETHSGFSRQVGAGGTMALEFLKELILTPQTKLYKLGMFVRSDQSKAARGAAPNGWTAYVYDALMLASNREAAAQYFYELFLGCSFMENSALQTKKFYDLTKEFIHQLGVDESEKSDLFTGLYTYLKVDQSPTVEVGTFANSYLSTPAMRDAFEKFMGSQHFPLMAVAKDLADIRYMLRQRKVTFGGDIRLSAPPERFKDAIEIEEMAAPDSPRTAPHPGQGSPSANGSAGRNERRAVLASLAWRASDVRGVGRVRSQCDRGAPEAADRPT